MLQKISFPKYWRKYKKPLVILAYTLVFSVVLFFLNGLFSVSQIEVLGTDSLKGLEIIQAKLIFSLSKEKVENQLYLANPSVKSVEVTKIYPNKVKIEVLTGEVLAAFSVVDGYLFLSADGRILTKKRSLDSRPTIINYYQKFGFNQFSVGERVTFEDVLYSLFFIEKISQLGLPIDVVDINGLDMLILKSSGKSYFLTTKKDRETQLNQLKTMVERLKLAAVDYESVDLRFDKPIIKLTTQPRLNRGQSEK